MTIESTLTNIEQLTLNTLMIKHRTVNTLATEPVFIHSLHLLQGGSIIHLAPA